MQVDIKYFYTDGTEIEEHDLVYLEGFEEDINGNFSGLCRVASINGDILRVYLLGYDKESYRPIKMYFEHIEKLVKVDSEEIDKALEKVIKKDLVMKLQ